MDGVAFQAKHCTGPSRLLPRYLQLELSGHVPHARDFGRFCLPSATAKVQLLASAHPCPELGQDIGKSTEGNVTNVA